MWDYSIISMNKKDERIKKLYQRGVTNLKVIAKKLGYNDNEEGVARVLQALDRLGITPKQ